MRWGGRHLSLPFPEGAEPAQPPLNPPLHPVFYYCVSDFAKFFCCSSGDLKETFLGLLYRAEYVITKTFELCDAPSVNLKQVDYK